MIIYKINKKGFTLVELIIVITILAILGTIGFVSFQNYALDARNSKRLTTIQSIQTGISLLYIKTGKYPQPENPYTTITSSGKTIGYQGYFGDFLSSTIKMTNLPSDPLDNEKYTYSTNKSQNKYQFLVFMEKNQQLGYNNLTTKVYAINEVTRYPKVFGDNLGIILNTNSDVIQGLTNYSSGTVDVTNGTGDIKVVIDNTSSGTITGTGSKLSIVVNNYLNIIPEKTCSTQPNYTNATFTIGNPINQDQQWQNTNPSDACYWSCNGIFKINATNNGCIEKTCSYTSSQSQLGMGYSPLAIAIDSAGNIYTTSNSSLRKTTPDGVTSILRNSGGEYITIDSYGNIYTSNQGMNIVKTTPDGVTSYITVSGNSFGAMISDSILNIYAINYTSNNIIKITPGGVSSILGTTGNNPYGITIDPAGNIYNANYNSNNVTKITPDGVSSILGTTGNNPYGITIDSAGNIYTANYNSNNVTKITPDGVSSILGTTGDQPMGIEVDTAGNVYTQNGGSLQISKINPNGVTSSIGNIGSISRGIKLDSAGNIYTINNSSNLTKQTISCY